MKEFIIFFVNKNGLADFFIVDALNLKEAMIISKSFFEASKYEFLGVCRNCFKSFKLDHDE